MLTIKVVKALVHGRRPNRTVRKGTKCDLSYMVVVFWIALRWAW